MPDHQPSVRACKRGQALVLACLSLLLLALMSVLSFNLGHALREKTRLQQHSDALAYSMAVVEARALNYFAVSNRAIAASYAAMNSIHGYMSAMTVTGDMMSAGSTSFYVVAAEEAAMCNPWGGFQHCLHILEAIKVAMDFSDKADEYYDKAKNLDQKGQKAVESLDNVMDGLHQAQREVFDKTAAALADGSSGGLGKLRTINAPKASQLNGGVGGLNKTEFTCVIDGKNCSGSGKPANSSTQKLAAVMTEVANATRPAWAANRGQPVTYLSAKFIKELTKDIQQDGYSLVEGSGGGKTAKGSGKGDVHSGSDMSNTGAMSVAHEHGTVATPLFKHFIAGIGTYDTKVVSNASGGEHEPDDAHQGGNHEFEGVNAKDLASCASSGNCFMQFRADPDPNHDYGQPRVYSYVTQKLRTDDVGKAPWELNSSAKVTFKHGDQGEGTVELAANEGAAVSKALVYYHRLRSWQEQPNLFGPFWRAKLHPFSSGSEAANVLQKAGNSDSAEMASAPNMPL
ncbi:pilus assembly protein TadG-related protein [Stigmatella hybrida]|uniref:pilus assembly protein TadG-related protein n=1 Tax=Stigmatella hybrida TaxID=394097 RepID=UPI001CDA883A|nr:pilus assembly protein TadG-related protein [Stigmatella hybrida]